MAFEASFILPIECVHIKTRVWMIFDNTKAPEKLTGKELCIGFVSAKVSLINYLKDDLSFLMTWVLKAAPLPSYEITCDCLVCTGRKEAEFNCLYALDTDCMVPRNVSNLGVLFITQFKDKTLWVSFLFLCLCPWLSLPLPSYITLYLETNKYGPDIPPNYLHIHINFYLSPYAV